MKLPFATAFCHPCRPRLGAGAAAAKLQPADLHGNSREGNRHYFTVSENLGPRAEFEGHKGRKEFRESQSATPAKP